MSKYRQKLIIVDGPDGVGKTTLIDDLINEHPENNSIIAFKKTLDGKTPAMIANRSEIAIFETMLMYLDPRKSYILDRGYMSNYVYSKFRGEPEEVQAMYLNDILRLMSTHDVMFITLIPSGAKTEDYADDLIDLTADAYNEITKLYIDLVDKIRSHGMRISEPVSIIPTGQFDRDSLAKCSRIIHKVSKFNTTGVII